MKRGEKQISASIKCENEKIIIETEELPDKDKTERIRIEEALKHGLYEKVKWWLTVHYQLENENDRSTLTASDGVTQTKIYFSIWKDQLLLSFLTPIADRIDAENLPYILEKNMNLRFGKFAVESDGNVFFDYSMLGNNCSENNFRSVFQNFVETAGK